MQDNDCNCGSFGRRAEGITAGSSEKGTVPWPLPLLLTAPLFTLRRLCCDLDIYLPTTPTETKKVANNSQISSPLLHAQELENIFFLRETYPVLQVPNELKIIFSPQSCGPQETKYSGREGERQRETRHES